MQKFLLIVCVCLLGASTCWISVISDTDDDLFLKNVEALADEENGNGGLFEYPDGFPYSFTCNVKTGEGIIFDDYCSATVVTCQGGGRGCNSRRCPVHG